MVKVSVVKCKSYNSDEVKRALKDSLKNIGFTFKRNQKILIKPNILGPYTKEQAITTHPIVLEELCKILKQYNSKIFIGESSSLNQTIEGAKVSGILDVANKYGKFIDLDSVETIQSPVNSKVGFVHIPKLLSDMDLIINLPKLKTHGLTGMTCSVKNLYGLIKGDKKIYYHRILHKINDLSELFVEINELIKPQLTIVDGIIGLEGMGPGSSGQPINSGLIISGTNSYSIDIIASDIMGFKKNQILTNKIALEKGYFKEHIELIGDAKEIRYNFKKPKNITTGAFVISIAHIFTGRPKINFDNNKCIKCYKCKKTCPTKAITLDNFKEYPICNHKKCINCFCCIEVCPKKAINIKENFFYSFLLNSYQSFKKVIK